MLKTIYAMLKNQEAFHPRRAVTGKPPVSAVGS
jgi:hypothetical protein